MFTSSEKKTYYKYWQISDTNRYLCSRYNDSKPPTVISAKMEIDDSGNEKFMLCRKSHVCQPYSQPPLIFTKAPYIKKYISDSDVNHVLVYASSEKKEYYKYFLMTNSKTYYCTRCCRNAKPRKYVKAKMELDENGAETFMVSDTPHACKVFIGNDQ